MRQRFIAALAAFLLIASSAFGQGKTFMWKVEGEGGSVAYLLGSLPAWRTGAGNVLIGSPGAVFPLGPA